MMDCFKKFIIFILNLTVEIRIYKWQ